MAETASAVTPMMSQYFEIKSRHPGYLLFYRMGDFYELFFEDAEIASGALGIVLTKRGKHLGRDIPMCGVPIHAADDYLRKLIGLGHRVAICEQVEDPAEARKRPGKAPVRRDVVRLVTAGTLTEDDLLPQRAANFLAALAMIRHGEADFALAWADVSTGETRLAELAAESLADELARIGPAELILSEATEAALRALRIRLPETAIALVAADLFDSEKAAGRIVEAFAEAYDPTALTRVSRSALAALIAYVADSQRGAPILLRPPESEDLSELMAIDRATRNALELTAGQGGGRAGSLLGEIDCCVTAAGSRLIAARLAAPLAEPGPIAERLDAVGALAEESLLTEALRARLKGVPDLTRAMTRLGLDRGGPRDLLAIGRAVAAAAELEAELGRLYALPPRLEAVHGTLAAAPAALAEKLERAIAPDPPLLARDGGFVAKGFDEGLDRERALASETRGVLAALQARLVSETGIKSLKIKHNGVLGYFLEVPAGQGARLLEPPLAPGFIHRQTLASAMRFTTAELAELEGRIARAHEAALEIELGIFAELRAEVLAQADPLRMLADALAELDVVAALAHLAATRGWTRPAIDDSLTFRIEGGRHPVVERTVEAEGQSFVSNDCDLSGEAGEGGRLWLVTGPNMGGKSTFLRQNALIAILAQMGSFVPAESAHIGVVDKLFSRVGASDDIAHNRSTFMVEMVETAAILNRATQRSLVILDEIGRGTATFDGLSIAWATVEWLHDQTRCRGLFATHFHELTSLKARLPRLSNVTMLVREWEGEVVFLHEVGSGAADRSYGVQVARLAGLPEPVLARARQLLELLERRASEGEGPSGSMAGVLDELPLFAHRPPPVTPERNPLFDMLDSVHPDELTPRQAIDLLYELKRARDAVGRR